MQRMHQELFRDTMRWFGLDPAYGAHIGTASTLTLATNNLMSLCGSFAAAEPEAAADVVFGARCAMILDALWVGDLLARFKIQV
ncbi:iron-containing redox enzyme family protein [Paractinoplanes toevensis]|uniref:Uncharacterized protein n=1 Tax=Paractinoplanes toevensis TaxID=571911 RepID=A0A919TE56_9ACTN|nr:iron-containing redox enzyme family protein [Actinoplanes toevensis]GIM93778.1 hypothetical protein Ato02nite_055710 [Actinoplanes toevensis]